MKKEDKVTVERGRLTQEQYVAALEAANKELRAENKRLVNVLIRQLDKREKDAEKCAKCLLKKD